MTDLSCQPCGCDPRAFWQCKRYPNCDYGLSLISISTTEHDPPHPIEPNLIYSPVDPKVWRKERPLYSGVLAYFPDALLEVAHVSFLGNKQHNPGQPLHWAREKSTDHLDCVARHITDHSKNPIDEDGALHLAKAAWRSLAELQLYLEKVRKV